MDIKEIRETIAEVYRVRDQIEYIGDKSKPFKVYCIVSMSLMGVLTIAALCTRIFGVAILSFILLLIIALLLWANNRDYKKVRFAVGRRLPIIIGMLQSMVIFAFVAMFSFQMMHGGMNFFDEELDYPGTYTYKFTEEIEGQEQEFNEVIVLNYDHTCEVTFQDTVTGEWHKDSMNLSDGSEYTIDVVGDELELLRDGEWYQFKRVE